MEDIIAAGESRTSMICVDEYDNGAMQGRLYNPGVKGGAVFENLMQLLLSMDSRLDTLNFPQSFAAKREFAPAAKPEVRGEADRHEGARATFAVKVLFRQNASWQGSVKWLEGQKEESFRSVLELLFLMNSALNDGERRAKNIG